LVLFFKKELLSCLGLDCQDLAQHAITRVCVATQWCHCNNLARRSRTRIACLAIRERLRNQIASELGKSFSAACSASTLFFFKKKNQKNFASLAAHEKLGRQW